MKQIGFDELDPAELEIDPVNERLSNVNPHSEEGESLQKSIEEVGVLEPIVVREVNGQYKVVAGQRRTLAAQAAEGVNEIPARIMDMDDSEARIVSITENAEQFQKDVPPEDRAAAITQLMEDGYSVEEIAERMGVSQPTIQRWLEPAREYWEGTVFEADPDQNGTNELLDSLSLQTMKTIRQNSSSEEQGEKIAKKVVKHNIKNKIVLEANHRSDTSDEFEKEIEGIIKELEKGIQRIREEIHFSGESVEMIDKIMKNRGISEKEAIEELVEEILVQIKYADKGRHIEFRLNENEADALDEIIGNRDVPKKVLAKKIVERRLEETGYL